MEIAIKTFVKDSRRPDWLIRLLYEVRNYCPTVGAISWIESAIQNATLVKRSKVYPLADCVRVDSQESTLTIYTLYKDNPIVEFKVNR